MSSYFKSHFPTGGLPAVAGDPGDREVLVVRAEVTDQEVLVVRAGATDQEVLVDHVEVAELQEVPAARAEVLDQGDLAEAGNQELPVGRDQIALFDLHVKEDIGTMAICKNYDYKDSQQIPFVQRGFVVE